MINKDRNGVIDLREFEIKDIIDIELLQRFQDNFNQISSTMKSLYIASLDITSNQHMLNEEISTVKNISVEINTILDSIKSIADKTKILGLNAAIEAAKAVKLERVLE